MGLSDCIKCWDTPCTCGYDYRRLSKEQRFSRAAVILGINVVVLEKLLATQVPEKHPRFNEE